MLKNLFLLFTFSMLCLTSCKKDDKPEEVQEEDEFFVEFKMDGEYYRFDKPCTDHNNCFGSVYYGDSGAKNISLFQILMYNYKDPYTYRILDTSPDNLSYISISILTPNIDVDSLPFTFDVCRPQGRVYYPHPPYYSFSFIKNFKDTISYNSCSYDMTDGKTFLNQTSITLDTIYNDIFEGRFEGMLESGGKFERRLNPYSVNITEGHFKVYLGRKEL